MIRLLTRLLSIVCFIVFVAAIPSRGQEEPPPQTDSALVKIPAPVPSVEAEDHKYDNGGAIDVHWTKSPDQNVVTAYTIYRSKENAPFEKIEQVLPAVTNFVDENVEGFFSYRYRIGAVGAAGESLSEPSNPAISSWELFHLDRLNVFLIAFVISAAVIFFIYSARAGRRLFVRKISGLEAIGEAVGRATEMGRPILFIPGIQDMDDVQTLAGITILGKVSRVIADYDSQIRMPVSRSLVMTSARETIKESYLAAGRPDAYSDDMVQYVTDEQFGYVAAVNGIMVREKPATCLYLGAFFAESLILAETGNFIGAIQIAGTAMPAQLPFFVAACDYTLIGEELFAASAYLSGEPKQLGSLKGQDLGKFLAMIAIVIGALAVTVGDAWHVTLLQEIGDLLRRIFSAG